MIRGEGGGSAKRKRASTRTAVAVDKISNKMNEVLELLKLFLVSGQR